MPTPITEEEKKKVVAQQQPESESRNDYATNLWLQEQEAAQAQQPQQPTSQQVPQQTTAPVTTAQPTGVGAPTTGVSSITGNNAPNFWQSQGNSNPAGGVVNNPTTVATQTGEKTGSETSTKTSTTTVSPYDPYKNVKDYDDAIKFLEDQINGYKPETPEEREKREKREKRTAFLARLGDAIGNMHTAYSYARGVKPMDLPNMSARAQQLYERAKAQRDRDKDRVMNWAITLGKLKDAKNRMGYEITKQEQEEKWKQQQAAEQADRWQKSHDFDKEQAQKKWEWQEKEAARDQGNRDKDRAQRAKEHEDDVKLRRAALAMQREAQKHAHQNNPNYTDFTLGGGRGTIRVPKPAINSQNFAVIYNSLPPEYRTATGDPIYTTDAFGKKVISGYSAPNANQMEIAIGAFLGDDKADVLQQEATRYALSQIGTRIEGKDINDTTPPSRRKK